MATVHNRLLSARSDTMDELRANHLCATTPSCHFDSSPTASTTTVYRTRKSSAVNTPTPVIVHVDQESEAVSQDDFELDTFAGCPKMRTSSSSNMSSSGGGTPSALVHEARQQMKRATKEPSSMVKHARFLATTQNKATKRSREKAVYARERKALKTIALIVCGFVICWLPFFVLYIVDVVANDLLKDHMWLFEVFLFLGYSNSAINPIIYTFCNGDFRRCFRDLLTLGCIRYRDDRRRSLCRPKGRPF